MSLKKFSTVVRKTFVFLIAPVLLLYLLLLATDNQHLIKAVRSTYLVGSSGPGIYDRSMFDNNHIKASSLAFNYPLSKSTIQLSSSDVDSLAFWETKSLVIIKHDTIRLAKYFNQTNEATKSNSFSVAKSLVSLAIGVALKKDCIHSLEDPIENYLPELQGVNKGKITIRQLLEMNSGIDFGESYGNPLGFMAKAYYGKQLYRLSMDKPLKYPPGKYWKYQGGNTLLLSFIVRNACDESLSDFFEHEVWTKIGAQYSADWTISDVDSLERAYCCFYSTAIDLAKVGRLYLNSGNWNGVQILDSSFIKESIQPQEIVDESGKRIDYYGLHWWLGNYKGEEFFYARGILGQYIVVIPNQKTIIVRQGHKRDKNIGARVPEDLYLYLKIAAQTFE